MSFFCNKQGQKLREYPIKIVAKALLWTGLLTCFLHSAAFASENSATKTTLRYGVLPDSSQEIIDSRFSPLIRYLKREAGIEIEYVAATDYQDLLNLFKQKKIDLVFFGGYTFIKAEKEAGALPLVMRDIDLRFSTVFLVHAKSQKTKLEDFKGASLSFGSRLSTSGHMMPRHFLTERNINPETFFSKVLYSDSHDTTAYWVRDGSADLGAANSTVIRKMFKDGKIKHSDVRILWETPVYSDYVWAVQPDIKPSLRTRLLDVFLSLSPIDPEHRRILSNLGAAGFLPANNSDFDLLRKVVKQLESK